MVTRPKAIIFDWDGTLVDTMGIVREGCDHVRKEFQLDLWTEEEFLRHVRLSLRDSFPKIYGSRAEEAEKIFYDFIEKNHLTHLQTMPGSLEMLDFLKEENIPAGIVSNKRHEYLKKEIGHLNWNARFTGIIGSGKMEKDKPDAMTLLACMDQMGMMAHREEIWYVGDMETDILLARNTNCPAILLQNGENKDSLIKKYNPLYVFNDCRALENALADCNVLENSGVA